MPVSSSGRIVKTRQGKKGGTQHQRNHRWESFTTKISKLNSLDPIRRVRRNDAGDAADAATDFSYFRTGLEKWQELNLSAGFLAFAQEVQPLCDNLAQVVHFEERIMELLSTYIEKGERESLDPLLELMTDFAHDLGVRFERYYERALKLVVAIAGTVQQDAAVIEWCFTCLAFMFKYLSKLLVPNLQPTYEVIVPLLGKRRQPPHIARFAAEAMSFLMRKAGAPAHQKSLASIIRYIEQDLSGVLGAKEFGLYYHGVMTLFAEAIKGNSGGVHTSGTAILRTMMATLESEQITNESRRVWEDVVAGVLTSIVHHTTSDTFGDILDLLINYTNDSIGKLSVSKRRNDVLNLLFSARAIGVACGVRKGSRIKAWTPALQAVANLTNILSKPQLTNDPLRDAPDMYRSTVTSVAIIMQYSPMDNLIPLISALMESLSKDPFARWFFVFCSYLAEVDGDRFKTIALPFFQRFVVAHWSEDNGDALCVLLPSMVSSGVLPSNYSQKGYVLPQSWQDQIVSKFERLEVSPFPEQASPGIHDRSPTTWHDRCLPKYNALLDVLEVTSVHPSTNARIAEILHRKLKLALRPSSSLAPEEVNFIVGRGFSAFCRMSKGAGTLDKSLKPLLRAAASRYSRLPNFLEALLLYEQSLDLLMRQDKSTKDKKTTETDNDSVNDDQLVESLINNLSTASSELRLRSLRLLEHIYNLDSTSPSKALTVMITIEQTQLDLQTMRASSMHVRSLAALYAGQTSNSWVKQAIVAFCFGMLTVKFAQIWDDATESLRQIAGTQAGEQEVARIAFLWLETPSLIGTGAPRPIDPNRNDGLTDFECSNLLALTREQEAATSKITKCRDTMLRNFAEAQEPVAIRPETARSQALRVLSVLPASAEKRSKQLVPMFLLWSGKSENDDDEGQTISNWTRKDQKSQLQLFALFTNSVSLYKADEVYDAILGLLGNGDIDIQKAALKAILTWNNKNVKPYEENLLNLLDEARFKDEISVLLQGDTLVRADHKPDLTPILLRLLYGRAISRKGAASGKAGMEAKRLTVLRNLSAEDVEAYLAIALGPLSGVKAVENGTVQETVLVKELAKPRKLLGIINMIEGILKELGVKASSFAQTLLDAVLYCTIYTSRQLGEAAEDDDEEATTPTAQTSLLKAVRKTGLKCLILLFANAADFDWASYIASIDSEIVRPRLDKLPVETSQGVSGILRLLFTWSSAPETVLLLGHNEATLPRIAECLLPEKTKDEVKLMSLDIVKNIAKMADGDDFELEEQHRAAIKQQLVAPYMDSFLSRIGEVLRGHHDISKDVLESCVNTVSRLSSLVTTSAQAQNLVDVSIFLLDQPLRRVNPRTKGELLRVLEVFVPLYNLQDDSTLKDRLYNTITSLFGFFTDNPSRQVLSRVLAVFADRDPTLVEIAAICSNLNAMQDSRLDSPDFDRRLAAFTTIRAQRAAPFTARQWRPLVFNMMYYIRDTEDLGVLSSNSSEGLCAFLDNASQAEAVEQQVSFKTMALSILLPAIYSGAKEQSEIVRREYCKVMAHLIRIFPEWAEVNDMHSLLAGDDELESSFFNNILTVGKGRQSSALGQLSAASEKRLLKAKNVSHFMIPLIEHFILDRAEGSDAHNLAAEATTTVGVLAESLEWPQYRAVLTRYTGYIKAKAEIEKQIIRLVGRVIDALATAASHYAQSDNEVDDVADLAGREDRSTLSRTLPKKPKFAEDLTNNIIPPLIKYLHGKDESTVSLRVPVAIIVVKLLKLLPDEEMKKGLPAVITDVCHILRSKAQESRDMTRETLIQICLLLGPSCFDFILKELRGALKHGPQLHIVSYTMHSMLVAAIPQYSPGDLDYCLPTIVDIIMNDIFGATGQEKDAEEYVSKMKEVKSSMSHDSMELVARTTTISQLIVLVQPIKELLKNRLNLRAVHKIDDLLKRIEKGLLRNDAVHGRESLIFCYQTIQDVYDDRESEERSRKEKKGKPIDRRLLQKGASKSGERSSATTVYTYKLVRFAFDLMSTILKKYDDLRIANNITNLLPVIRGALVEAEEEVKISSFRLLAAIIKVYKMDDDGSLFTVTSDYRTIKASPETTKAWAELYRIAANEARKSVLGASIDTSIFQESLKFLSVVYRNRPLVEIKKSHVDQILVVIKDHLTQPDYRHITFNFLRAVIDAQVKSAEVYDTLDHVGNVMVQNYDDETRRLAREAFFQFLSRYEQEKKRWKGQLDFIVANLKYTREGGRSSVLELILTLLTKTSDLYVRQVSERCLVPLIILLAEDESNKCRKEASIVLKEIFKRAQDDQLRSHLEYLRSWVGSDRDPGYIHIKLEVYGLYFESHPDDSTDVTTLQNLILSVLQTAGQPSPDAEHVFAALQLTLVWVKTFPSLLFSSSTKSLWDAIKTCLSFPDPLDTISPEINLSVDVKKSATLLLSAYLADFAQQAADSGLASKSLPLSGSGGLWLTSDDVTEMLRRSAYLLKKGMLSTELVEDVVKNIVFLATLAAENGILWHGKRISGSVEVEDEEEELDQDVSHVEGETAKQKTTLLGYLLERLSFILRKESSPPRAAALFPKNGALRSLELLTKHLPLDALTTNLPVLLLPLHNMTDPSIPTPYSTDPDFRTGYDALKSSAEELLETIKRRVGVDVYTKELVRVREGVKARRMQRGAKRKVEAVSAPEKYGLDKKRKGERKKERRKEKGKEFAARRREA